MAPTSAGVWVTFPTGMMAGLSFFRREGLATPGAIGNTGANSLTASLAGGELWLTSGDGSGFVCLDPLTGWGRGFVLRQHGPDDYYGHVVATPVGAFAADGRTIARIVPPVGCPIT